MNLSKVRNKQSSIAINLCYVLKLGYEEERKCIYLDRKDEWLYFVTNGYDTEGGCGVIGPLIRNPMYLESGFMYRPSTVSYECREYTPIDVFIGSVIMINPQELNDNCFVRLLR